MRPVELELVGFSAYRDRQVVDFRDADFFALVGATGSGKSSLIDGICFALYGIVPRFDDRRLVAPVITQGATEARVRFTFALGEDEYTAVRVVRRTATGASTREARLEDAHGAVLAGTADEVSATVERLLGLPYEHFTRCVVLPQGEFARFLHDKPRDRQELLVRLLDLGVYERMRSMAAERRTVAEGHARALEGRLAGDLATATPQAVATAVARAAALAALRGEVGRAQPELDDLAERSRAIRAEADDAARALAALRAVVVPAEAASLAARQADAALACTGAEEALRQASATAAAREAARTALGDTAALRAIVERHDERDAVAAELAQADTLSARRQAVAVAADAALDDATARLQQAAAHRADTERAHLAHTLAEHLELGAPCPVCRSTVQALPTQARLPTLEQARAAEAAAERAVTGRRRAQREAHEARATAAAQAEALAARAARLDQILATAAAPDAVAAALEAIARADAALAEARAAQQQSQRAHEVALADQRALDAALLAGRRAFTEARDPVVALGAPSPGGQDLAADWAALADWAQREGTTQEDRATALAARATAATARRQELIDGLRARCAEHGVEVGRDPVPEAVRGALAAAEAARDTLEALATAADEARAAMAAATRDRDLAQQLVQHLSARGFERWLLDEAMAALIEGASEILSSLTDGQYTMGLDDQGAFTVTDHHNAGERRLARTLSGGETFLASLALALSLADQLAGLASEGARRLETLFLDEGFGTLDGDTLDVVATAMEHLGASGRIVGLVTHVRELADRVPVRFEVTKDERTARVARVLA